MSMEKVTTSIKSSIPMGTIELIMLCIWATPIWASPEGETEQQPNSFDEYSIGNTTNRVSCLTVAHTVRAMSNLTQLQFTSIERKLSKRLKRVAIGGNLFYFSFWSHLSNLGRMGIGAAIRLTSRHWKPFSDRRIISIIESLCMAVTQGDNSSAGLSWWISGGRKSLWGGLERCQTSSTRQRPETRQSSGRPTATWSRDTFGPRIAQRKWLTRSVASW